MSKCRKSCDYKNNKYERKTKRQSARKRCRSHLKHYWFTKEFDYKQLRLFQNHLCDMWPVINVLIEEDNRKKDKNRKNSKHKINYENS